SDAGYGFVTKVEEMHSKNRAGKALLSLPGGARVMRPVLIQDIERQFVVVASNEGRMLVFPLKDLPQLAKGKGNKMISIPSARLQNREEYVTAIGLMRENDSLVIHSVKRHLKLRFQDLEHYLGERGRRGHKLPRGLQRVDRIEDRKSTRLNSSHVKISYAVLCLKKKIQSCSFY